MPAVTFGPKSGPTECWAYSIRPYLDQNLWPERLFYGQQTTKKENEKLPCMQRVNIVPNTTVADEIKNDIELDKQII